MKLTATRDELLAMRAYCFPFIDQLLYQDLRNALNAMDERSEMNARIYTSIFHGIKIMIGRRLMNTNNKFNFTLQECEAILLVHLLSRVPIDAKEVWILKTRQQIMEQLTLQIYTPQNIDGTN